MINYSVGALLQSFFFFFFFSGGGGSDPGKPPVSDPAVTDGALIEHEGAMRRDDFTRF